MFSMVFLAGIAMPISASDKKDDKKGGKGGDGKGQQPVVVVIYLPAWSPVMREI